MKQINVRIPDDLHARIITAAETDRRSINAEILWLIEKTLDKTSESDDAKAHAKVYLAALDALRPRETGDLLVGDRPARGGATVALTD
jgi:hypothetical protein